MNLLKSFYVALSLVTSFAFASCGDDDDNGGGSAPSFEVPAEILSQGLTFDAAGGENSFQVKSTERVTARVDGDDTSWITVNVGNRTTEGFNVTVKTQPNDTEAERTAKVVLFAANTPKTINVKQATSYVAPQPPQGGEDTDTPIKDVTAKQLLSRMVAGVNIGNTLEVPGGETGWGNPEVNEAYIKGLKALGFNAVRVPCAWDSHVSDAATNTIDPAWLDRVNQVVGWIVENDMYAIVNIHWDGGWLENHTPDAFNQTIDRKQHDYWTQIANRLNHFDEHVLFAGMNEPNGNDDQSVANIIRYQQTFIDAVRATGGNNALRCLVVQAPTTDINNSANDNYRKNMPKDNVADKLVMEVHFYDPTDFTIMDKDGAWFPGSIVKYFWGSDNLVPGSERNVNGHDESSVASQMAKMKKNYVDAGIPVIIGEYSSSVRNAGEYQAQHEASRAYWNEVVTREARNNGCVPFYWETGMDINRKDGTAKCQYAIDGIMAGVQASNLPF